MEIKTFHDLIAWQKAMALAREIYGITTQMPVSERFGLISQMRRAAVSVPSNIAEGYARQSRTEYIRYLKTARGSLAELQTQVILSKQLNFIPDSAQLNNLLGETDRVLQGLIRSLQNLSR